MASIKVQATEMKNARVNFISLVERGANRIPFRIVKQETAMRSMKGLDLSSMSGIFARKSETLDAEVVGVITLKGDGFSSVQSQVEEAGFSVVEPVEMEDGSVVFKQGEMDDADAIIRLNENAVIAVKGFKPYNMEISEDGVSFMEKVQAQGFYPGIGSVLEVLREAIMSAAREGASPSDASSAISKLFSEAQKYVASMVSALPAKAFKLEDIYPDEAVAEKSDEAAPVVSEKAEGEAEVSAAASTEEVAKSEESDAPVVETTDEVVAKAEEPVVEEAAKGEAKPVVDAVVEKATEKTAKALTEDDVSEIVSATVFKSFQEITSKMEDMLTEFSKTLTNSMAGVDERLETMSTQVDEAVTTAKSAKTALAGTAISGLDGDDEVTQTQKTETGARFTGQIDTAFLPRSRVRR